MLSFYSLSFCYFKSVKCSKTVLMMCDCVCRYSQQWCGHWRARWRGWPSPRSWASTSRQTVPCWSTSSLTLSSGFSTVLYRYAHILHSLASTGRLTSGIPWLLQVRLHPAFPGFYRYVHILHFLSFTSRFTYCIPWPLQEDSHPAFPGLCR